MRLIKIIFLIIPVCILVAGCDIFHSESVQTPTVFVPTSTMEPMAAIVNGEGITLMEYQAELDRYLAAIDTTTMIAPASLEPRTIVLDNLINEVLLSQAAYQAGFQINDTELDARVHALSTKLGGTQALLDWESNHGYTETSLRHALRRSISATWMRDKVIENISDRAEQVHVRQILLTDEQTAFSVKTQLDNGANFIDMAYQYDPIGGGDLGWFPRGYLNFTEVETAAFSLLSGEYSSVIKTDIGWHIILVIEKDENHELTPDAFLTLQHKAISQWLTDHRSQSSIEILI